MSFLVPVEIEVVASSAEDAQVRVQELLQLAVFQWRKTFNIEDFVVKGGSVSEVGDSGC